MRINLIQVLLELQNNLIMLKYVQEVGRILLANNIAFNFNNNVITVETPKIKNEILYMAGYNADRTKLILMNDKFELVDHAVFLKYFNIETEPVIIPQPPIPPLDRKIKEGEIPEDSIEKRNEFKTCSICRNRTATQIINNERYCDSCFTNIFING